MAHYFTNEEKDTTPIPVTFEINGKTFDLTSSSGVFSKDKLDTGTRILLEAMLKEPRESRVLDLGCGIGVVGVVLSSFWNCEVTGIDVNKQACTLTRENYLKYHVDGQVLCQDGISGGYGCIALNPPIRAGKEVIYRLFKESFDHLVSGGCLYVVIRKQHGAPSAVKYLESLGFEVTRLNRDKGFWVLKCVKKQNI